MGETKARGEWYSVKLPISYREKLNQLKRKSDRAVMVEVRRAVDAYLLANGIEPPVLFPPYSAGGQ